MFSDERINLLQKSEIQTQGKYVLYWMQSAQRVLDNHALEFAIFKANELNVPLLVTFVVIPDFPSANARHFLFMLQGIQEVERELRSRGIGFCIKIGNPVNLICDLAQRAKLLIFDKGYSLFEREIRSNIIRKYSYKIYEIDTNLIVPIDFAYPKEAYAAYAIRPSIMRKMDLFNESCEDLRPNVSFKQLDEALLGECHLIDSAEQFLKDHLGHLVKLPTINTFIGGTSQALKRLEEFIKEDLSEYEENQSDPGIRGTSKISPYLHFGQISPITILRLVGNNAKGFIEQLVVRRELAYNYIYYAGEKQKELKDTLPSWAYETLMHHAQDPREYLYKLEVIEHGKTHDPYFNAAQHEMVYGGHMHNTMRMYWGKKIIEWTTHPDIAYKWIQYLNDKYSLDGRDPNGYAGIAWCFGKHDRPWQERAIFGKVRYMNDKGLTRKYNMAKYIAYVAALRGADCE